MPDPTLSPQAPKPAFPPELALVFITILWGGTFLIVRIAERHGGALGLVALRFALGGGALLATSRLGRPTGAERRAGLLIGAVLFIGYATQAEGLTSIASSRSAFFTALYVPLVPLVEFALFRARPRTGGLVGIALAFAGLLLLAHPAGLAPTLSRGDLLTLLCALAVSFEITLIGRLAPHGNPLRLAAIQMLTVAALAAAAALVLAEPIPSPAAWPPFWLGATALGAATAAIMAIQNWAQKTVPPLRATLIFAAEPVWAGLIGALAGDRMDAQTLAGAGLIVAGVLAGAVRRRKARAGK